MSALRFEVEWLEAPDVRTPELAATWARYELWVGGDCVTQVEAGAGFRRSVYGSLYPLAEWIAANWWLLTASSRPSATPGRYRTWPNLPLQDWLRHHNLRAAGNGMAWPDLTIVPEGAATSLVWAAERRPTLGAVRFTSAGSAFAPTVDIVASLAELVTLVLDRLADMGLGKSRLAEDWTALGRLDQDERAFCEAAARLGLDPFAVPDEMIDAIVAAADQISVALVPDFFDNADPAHLVRAAAWTRAAAEVATDAARRAGRHLDELRAAVAQPNSLDIDPYRPWKTGYAMARDVRRHLCVPESSRIDISPWLATGEVGADPGGMQGLAALDGDRCGLVLGSLGVSRSSRTFAQARTLGRTLVQPSHQVFLLSATHGRDEQVARAFAAELLAPAAGIQHILDTHDQRDDIAVEAAADHFGVSPVLITHQYENQLADGASLIGE